MGNIAISFCLIAGIMIISVIAASIIFVLLDTFGVMV